MESDPDVALPSIETREEVAEKSPDVVTAQSDGLPNVSMGANSQILDTNTTKSKVTASPTRTPLRTERVTSTANSSRSPVSRSPSSASLHHERSSTPRLDRKRSVPNLSIRNTTPSRQPQFRRASSVLNPATPVRTKVMDRPQMTAASVAKEYFQRDLAAHEHVASKTVVIHHDACYGHRFSRPKATKAMLGSIVERPERIHATLLGASTAYVRLGGRHSHGRKSPRPDLSPSQPPFRFRRTARSIPLSHPAVVAVHGNKWMESLQLMCDTAEAKLAMGQKELTRPIGHTKDSRGNTLPALHSGDLYLAAESLAALQGCLGGVCDAVDMIFQPDPLAQRAFVCIRPPGHHCSAEMPSGFCWLNNVHVGITYAAMNHGLTHAAIIDFDLHHGDGSQTIAWDHNRSASNIQNPKHAPSHKKTPIGYYSLHDINSYPCEYGDEDKVRNASTCLHTAHGQSIWNVHLEQWTTLDHFWILYESKYKVLLDKAASFLTYHSDSLRQAGVEPRAAIFLSSGFDASQWESEGMQRHKVNVPTDFYAKITADVVELSELKETGVDGRVISVLEGGYSDRALTSGVLSHLCGLTKTTTEIATRETASESEKRPAKYLDQFMDRYDPAWWNASELELLEAIVYGHLPPPIQKATEALPSSYLSPTHASTAKMTEVAKERRSVSAQIEARIALENAPPEPVPEVDWVTAAYELSRLLIPGDRQTQSCTHEELNAENSRVRRDRQSLLGRASPDLADDMKKMQLRDRKAKPVITTTQLRTTSRGSNRRTTIAAASELPDPTVRDPPRTRRRSSAASSVLSGFHNLKLDDTVPTQTRSSPPIPVSAPTIMPVKKTRAPTRKPASTANSPRKARTNVPKQSLQDREDQELKQSPTNGPVENNAVDELTSGMKKISIKLKMPTEEQHHANMKKSEEVATQKPKAARKPPVPRAPRKAVAIKKPGAQPTPAASSDQVSQATTGTSVQHSNSVPPGYLNAFTVQPDASTTSSSAQTNAATMSALDFLSSTRSLSGSTAQDDAQTEGLTGTDDDLQRPLETGTPAEQVHYPAILLKTELSSLQSAQEP